MSDDSARQAAVREFLEGPSLRDAMIAAVDLARTEDWLARPLPADAARGHGLEPWMRARFGVANP